MKNKIVIVVLSVLLSISVVYGVIATIAVRETRKEVLISGLTVEKRQEILSPALSVMRSLGMTGYSSWDVDMAGENSADVLFIYPSGKRVKAGVVSDDGETWHLLSLSNGKKEYYWLDDSVAHCGTIVTWESD